MQFSFTDEPCPHEYFPEINEIVVTRRQVTLSDLKFGYLDYYNTEDTTYFLTLYIEPEFRGGKWFELIQQYGHHNIGDLPTDIITADLKEKRVLLGVSEHLLGLFRSNNSFLSNYENGRGNLFTHYVSGAEHLVIRPTDRQGKSSTP